jgi:hypothetical protein
MGDSSDRLRYYKLPANMDRDYYIGKFKSISVRKQRNSRLNNR